MEVTYPPQPPALAPEGTKRADLQVPGECQRGQVVAQWEVDPRDLELGA